MGELDETGDMYEGERDTATPQLPAVWLSGPSAPADINRPRGTMQTCATHGLPTGVSALSCLVCAVQLSYNSGVAATMVEATPYIEFLESDNSHLYDALYMQRDTVRDLNAHLRVQAQELKARSAALHTDQMPVEELCALVERQLRTWFANLPQPIYPEDALPTELAAHVVDVLVLKARVLRRQ